MFEAINITNNEKVVVKILKVSVLRFRLLRGVDEAWNQEFVNVCEFFPSACEEEENKA